MQIVEVLRQTSEWKLRSPHHRKEQALVAGQWLAVGVFTAFLCMALQSEAKNTEPPCFVDLETLQKKLSVDPSGQLTSVPDCGDAITLKILKECLNDDPDIRHGGRIRALNNPHLSSKWSNSMISACHVVVDTTGGAFGLRYGFDFSDNRLGMTYTTP